MISFEDAKKKALELKKEADMCTEFEDAFLFYDSKAEDSDGGSPGCVIMKKDARAMASNAYISQKIASRKRIVEIREIAL